MYRRLAAFCFVAALAPTAFGQAPLTVNGIADRTTYTDTVSFSVPVTPGYSYSVLLDDARVPAGVANVVQQVDYHEVRVWRTNAASAAVTNLTVRFIVQSSTRGSPEKGLTVWTPYPPISSTTSEWAGATLHILTPADYPQGLDIPVAAWVDDGQDRIVRGNGWVAAAGFESSAFRLVRGHGSGFLPAISVPGAVSYNATLSALTASARINIESATMWTTAGGTLAANTVWPENSRIALTSNLTIPAGTTLSVGAGTVVKISPLVNIVNNGTLVLEGSRSQPVILTPITRPAPERNTGAWGGIVMRGGKMTANWAVLTGAGGATSFDFSPGASHRAEQALLLAHSGAVASLTNCFLLNQAGQVANGFNSDVTFDHCLLQRAITSGESVGGTIVVNHSAIIEFPSIDGVYNATIAESDYDAIYFTTGTHILKDSLLGFCKDDAIDSGSGGAGTVLVTNCWVESALHEGLAWSGGGRQTWTYDSVLMNCGQGIEAGWTEGTADRSPDCFAERLLSTANSVGARFGDNYESPYYGFLRMTNSLLLYNYRDVFAKTWNTSGSSWNTNQWVDRLAQMDLRSNSLTRADSRFPANEVWGAAPNRLTPFMSTPADAPVGIGFAVWSTQAAAMTSLFEGVPVRLSSFTPHPVSVDYVFSGPAGALGSGTLVFTPGETVKRIHPASFDLQGLSTVSLELSNAKGCEITDLGRVTFVGSVAAPTLAISTAAAQVGMERLSEGVPLRLNGPSSQPVTVDYHFRQSTDRILASGSVTFNPGVVLVWVNPPPTGQELPDLVRFEITSVTGAALPGLRSLVYVQADVPQQAPPLTLLSKGAPWKYLDDGSNQGTAWRAPGFPDGSWASGRAELGFNDNDETTILSRTNKTTGATNITFYFRSYFTVTNPAGIADLSMWLLRDDGGVVYLNGNEVYRTANMGSGTVYYDTFTTDLGEDSIDTATVPGTNLVEGINGVAVEIHQRDLPSSDISFDFELIGNRLPATLLPQELHMGVFDGDLLLGWGDPAFVLEQATTVTGPWTQVTSPSPITVSPTNSQMFYRLKR